ncbi:uncharacterized protein LOC114329037 isoform X1 [Diabrotica virgifera virgifera]|uniref:Uncharacterized protein LOC114329037 isoform X1 n=1 Tax=Diabrotica virgifera virgifera TaxID=50390 RepID=A0A6P7FLJ0_DIAVI|nr:uncharacterized protein LOC114329037 isoform X1 [Diabrotica virgifera virgifera]
MKTALVLALLSCVALTVSAQHEPTLGPGPRPEPTRGPIPDELRCDTCVTLADIIKGYADERIPLDEVRHEAEKLCRDLPEQLREACERELLPNLDKVYEELKRHTPLEFCKKHEQCK